LLVLVASVGLLQPSAALAQVSNQAPQIPAPVGLVNDFAHVIPDASAAHIAQIAEDVRSKSRGEMAVVTLPDIAGHAPSDVALQIGRQWKVGKIGAPGDPTRNAGVVILIVPKESSSDGHGHCFVTVGQGAEGFITDGDAGDMCREAVPFFQRQQYGDGIELVTYQTAQRFANEFHFALDTTLHARSLASSPPSSGNGGGFSPAPFFLLLIIVYFVLSAIARRGGGRRGCLPIFIPFGGTWGSGGGWSSGGGGGGGGGGFGGFGGGGGFSGGGGGSDW